MNQQPPAPTAQELALAEVARQLLKAVRNGRSNMVRALIKAGASLQAQDEDGYTPLMLACSEGHAQVVRVLLDSCGANQEARHAMLTAHRQLAGVPITPLVAATRGARMLNSSEPICALLQGSGDDTLAWISAAERQELVLWAAGRGHPRVLHLLLAAYGQDTAAWLNLLISPNEAGILPLLEAASNGHVESAAVLLDSCSSDPVARAALLVATDPLECTALMHASMEGHVEVVGRLLASCGDDTGTLARQLAQRDKDGRTALHYAFGKRPSPPAGAVASALGFSLPDQPAAVNEEEEEQAVDSSELEVWARRQQVLQLLIAHGADPNVKSWDGLSALDIAAHCGCQHWLPSTASAPLLSSVAPGEAPARKLPMAAIEKILALTGVLAAIHLNSTLQVRTWTRANQAVWLATRHGPSEALVRAAQSYLEETALALCTELLRRYGAKATQRISEALVGAAGPAHWDCVRLLIEHGANASAQGSAALAHAARTGEVDMIRLLVQHGADVRESEALLCAATRDKTEVVELLLDLGARANDGDGQALIQAATHGQLDNARLLLAAGADARAAGTFSRVEGPMPPGGRVDMANMLLTHKPGATATGSQALVVAAERGDTEMVRLLLEHGAEPTAQDSVVLLHSVVLGDVQLLRLFLRRGEGQRVHTRVREALVLAAAAGRDELVNELVAYAADTGVAGGAALLPPAEAGSLQLLRVLLEGGERALVGGGGEALPLAARAGRAEALQMLLEHGATEQQSKALYCAIRLGRSDMVRLLLTHGARPWRTYELDLARELGHDEVAAVLLEYVGSDA